MFTGDIEKKIELQKENLYKVNLMMMMTTAMKTFAVSKIPLRNGESQLQVQRRHSPTTERIQGVSCKTNVPI